MTVELVVVDGPEEAALAAAERLAVAAAAGAHIALAGGSTPRKAYELAAGLEGDWSAAALWWGDERCVPPDDERSNFRMAQEALLDRLAARPRCVHRIRGELEPAAAAARYDRELRGVALGLTLLGLGPDGHTASLFPNDAALEETERLAVAVQALGVDRVTLTAPALRGAEQVVFLAVGKEKAEAAERAFARPPDPATPASLIRSAAGRTVAILDRAAAARLHG